MSGDEWMRLFADGLIAGVLCLLIGYVCGWNGGIGYAAKESISPEPSVIWRREVIDAEAERAKEAIK